MKNLILVLTIVSVMPVLTLPTASRLEAAQLVTVQTFLDVGNPTVRINAKAYRYVLGSPQAKSTHLNPAGRTNIVNLTGYFKTVGIENVFVITQIAVIAEQG